MKCTVFGGGGFLGSYLCEELVHSGYKVRVFEREKSRKTNLLNIIDKIEWIEGDFNCPNNVQDALIDTDILFHLVSSTVPKTSNDDPIYDIETNLLATLNMLKIAIKAKVKKVIFFSSGGTVYGIPKEIPIKETHSTEPISSYGIHKLAIEKYLYLFNHLYGMDYGILRISNPYGPRQAPQGTQGAIAVFVNRALKKESIEIWGDGSVVRDYIYVTDVARAAVALLSYEGEQKIFNIGSGGGRSLLDIITAVETNIGFPINVQFKDARSLDVPVNILDINAAKRQLLWRPKVGFNEGLALTIDYLSRI